MAVWFTCRKKRRVSRRRPQLLDKFPINREKNLPQRKIRRRRRQQHRVNRNRSRNRCVAWRTSHGHSTIRMHRRQKRRPSPSFNRKHRRKWHRRLLLHLQFPLRHLFHRRMRVHKSRPPNYKSFISSKTFLLRSEMIILIFRLSVRLSYQS